MVTWLNGHPEKPTVYRPNGYDENNKHPIPTYFVTSKPQPVLPDSARYERSSGAVGRVLLAMVKATLRPFKPLLLPLYPLYAMMERSVIAEQEEQAAREAERATNAKRIVDACFPDRPKADVYNARDHYKVGDVVSIKRSGVTVQVEFKDGALMYVRDQQRKLELELKENQQAQYDLEYKFRGLS